MQWDSVGISFWKVTMSTLRVSQIKGKLLSMFEKHLDLSDVGPKDGDREQKILSRCLAALSIYLQAGCTEKEAAESVWDGADDNGIDAAYFDASDMRIILSQSKWINKGSGEPEASDLRTFVQGVRDVIEQDQTHFHTRLHARFNDIALRLNNPGTSVHLVVVTTGSSTLAPHGSAVLNDFLKNLNGEEPDPIASCEVLGLKEVYSGLANDPLQSTVAIEANILDWSYIPSPYPAYFGLVDGLQLKTWWKTHGKGLLSANIRHSLGSTEVNNEIRQTATSSPENFWYFNNGITLVAEDKIKAPAGAASHSSGIFSFKGASIVNGAQTVSSLAKVDNDICLGKIRVPIRIILLKDAPAQFGSDVTRTNNLQNRVELRDFVAQDPEQKRLRQEMAIEGIVYQFVRSEDSVPTATTCELVEVTTALACAAGDANLAVQVKTGIGRFYADLNKAPYKTVFNPTISGAKAFNATVMLREIENWIEKRKKELSKKSGAGWGVLIHGNRILAAAVFKRFGIGKLSQPISEFPTVLSSTDLNHICDQVHQTIAAEIDKNYKGKFLAVLFKNPSVSKLLFDMATSSSPVITVGAVPAGASPS